ncbi:MAG: hypothetical protein WCD25_18460 [Pseudolabrys sp.]
MLRTNKKKQMAEKKKKACGNIIVPTAECGVNGSTRPTLPPSQADGSKANPKGPSPAYTTVTLSNGVTTSAIFNGKGLTVTSTSPGTITVSNGTNTVTMPGGSMNLSGAASVQAGASVQLMRHPNGDVTVAANLAVGSRERAYKTDCRSKQRPARGHFTDDLKAAGNATAVIVASPIVAVGAAGVTVGAALVGVVTGHPIQVVKETGGRVIEDAAAVVEWVGGWF